MGLRDGAEGDGRLPGREVRGFAFPTPRALGSASRPAGSPGDPGRSLRDSGRKANSGVWPWLVSPPPDLLGHAAGPPLSVASSSALPLFNPEGRGPPLGTFSLNWDLKSSRDCIFKYWLKNALRSVPLTTLPGLPARPGLCYSRHLGGSFCLLLR